ncbi:MAG: TetR/AcrR family transcriptional regulator [Pseudomonadota bacterium]
MAQSKKTRRPRGSLTTQKILEASHALLVRGGVDALSIRKIADELNASTMSIYNHFPNKHAIISELVASFVARAHQREYPMDDWQEWVFLTFSDIYTASINEPDFLTLMVHSGNIGLNSVNVFKRAQHCLVGAGFSSDEAIHVFYQLFSFTLGAAMLRVNLIQHAAVDESDHSETNSKYDAHSDKARYWNHARDILLGDNFSPSLKRLVASFDVG